MRKIVFLLVFILCLTPAAMAENYAMNLFLSNFTEVGVEQVDTHTHRDALVDFAHDHMWFNDHEAYEYGEYENDNNCRVSDDRILEIIDNFFYAADVNEEILDQTRYDYDGEYYYHCETGGWNNCGFAHTINVYPAGEDKYFVSFLVFENGESWENDVLDDNLDEIIAVRGEPVSYGSALIYAEDLADRSTFKMISYSRH